MSDAAQLQELLRTNTPLYMRHCAKIVSETGELVPCIGRPAQLRFDEELEKQRAAGLPMRAIVLKARKLGFSTWTQGKIHQRTTLNANHFALTVAHNHQTASVLFEMAERMYENLPDDPDLRFLKPDVVAITRGQGNKYMRFGIKGSSKGLNSSLNIDTATQTQSARGLTIHSLHGSEVAFWPSAQKLTALLNAVPKVPESMVILESTANGHNFFKDLWDAAVAGESGYIPFFAPWHEQPEYRYEFPSEEERERFVETIGRGELGAEEPYLIEKFGCEPEQLLWRRRTIASECSGDLEMFHQEYPSTPEEAFVSTGRTVFPKNQIQAIIDRTAETDPAIPSGERAGPEVGRFVGEDFREFRTKTGSIRVPQRSIWVPDDTGQWRIWEHPKTAAEQFTAGGDVAGGLEGSDVAWHAIQVVSHSDLGQCAEYRSRVEHSELALEMLLAGLYYNRAWAAFEITGGWGLAPARILALDYHYTRSYRRKKMDAPRGDKFMDRLGWDTTEPNKRLLITGLRELMKDSADGIKSAELAQELRTFVMDDRGRAQPEPGKFSDLLMAYMIAQQVAREHWLKPSQEDGTSRVVDMSTRRVRVAQMGY